MTVGSAPLGLSQSDSAVDVLEPVQGSACYSYGDNETPAQAKRAARSLALEQAARSHRVFVKSESKVRNFQLVDDVVTTAVAEELRHIKVEKMEKKGQEVCVTITARINPFNVERKIDQQVAAKEIAQEAQQSFVSDDPVFGVRVWTNQADGRYQEGDHLVVYVESERDAFIKIDYFQADGSVVHLVPNMYRGQSFIEGGRRYAFGDTTGPDSFIITGPFGAEMIKVIASPVPFSESTTAQGLVSESRNYLQGLRKGMRGVKIVSSSSVALHTESRAVAEYKATRGGRSSRHVRSATEGR